MKTNHLEEQINLLIGTDQFGRSFSPVTGKRPNKKVGMFFWLWIGQPLASGIYDAGKILSLQDGQNILLAESSDISPNGQQHFWGEPIWGYYNSADEWVIRKQIELIMLAGIDFIVFDTTNAVLYQDVYEKVLSIIEEYQLAGFHPPLVAFYTHSYSMKTALELYQKLYLPKKYETTWYCENGKPVIIAYVNPAEDKAWALREMKDENYQPPAYPQEMLDLFCFKRPQWPTDPYLPDGFPWIEWQYPQPVHGDMINVTVASHPMVPFSFSLTRDWINWGRGWDVNLQKNCSECVNQGIFFQSQWNHAQEADPDTVFVGGWNEWIAYKQLWNGEYMLCDAVNKEYSRDIEPMQGEFEDAFYIQLIQNVRRYKNTENQKSNYVVAKRNYYATLPNMQSRNYNGVSASITYHQQVPNNIIKNVEIQHLLESILFTVVFQNDIKDEASTLMELFIGLGEPHIGKWESYDFKISVCLEKGTIAAMLEQDGILTSIPVQLQEKIVSFQLPVYYLANSKQFYWKAASGVTDRNNIMSYYTSGSVLPPGRLSYVFYLE